MNSTPSGDSPSRNSSDQQGSPRRSPSTIRRSFLSHTTPYDTQGASPSPASTDIEPRPRSQGPGTDLREYTETAERGSSRHGPERSSPSLSSSQGDMADTEMEAGPSQSSDAPQPTASPPKKKRTRTLTTPHQSAVLHALLAQSRFPTTAMREEVGRAIGLSARKVQIWFQNQRQKARRPRGQATTPLTRPPQFGPFQNAHLGSSSSDMAAFPGTSAQAHTSSGSHLVHLNPVVGYGHEGTYHGHQESQMSRALPRSVTSPYLSGPGIPGSASSSSARTDYTLPRDARGAAVARETPRPSTSYPTVNRASTYIRPRPATAEVLSSASFTAGEHTLRQHRLSVDSRDTQLDHPVTLPPLVIGPEPNRRQASTSPFSSISEVWRRWHPSPAGGMSPRPLAIPPPFTLQPHPQWDDPAFSPFSRPSYQIGHPSTSSAASGYGSTMPPISPPVTSPSAESHPSSLARHHRAESVSSGNSTRESPTHQTGRRSYDYDNFHE